MLKFYFAGIKKDPEPDPYLWLMDPGGPKTRGSKSPILVPKRALCGRNFVQLALPSQYWFPSFKINPKRIIRPKFRSVGNTGENQAARGGPGPVGGLEPDWTGAPAHQRLRAYQLSHLSVSAHRRQDIPLWPRLLLALHPPLSRQVSYPSVLYSNSRMINSAKWFLGFALKEVFISKKAMLRIRDVYPGSGSEFFHPGSRFKKIPDPGSGSASKNLSIFDPKNCF